ncbi:MAG: type II secretion system protein [Planctomycetota bacterium]
MPRRRLPNTGRARGFSFLEAVASTALLGIVAASVLGGVAAVIRGQERMKHSLACAELANRLVVAWLHDRKELSRTGDVIDYDNASFRWEFSQRPIRADLPLPTGVESRQSNLLSEVQCTVWLYDGQDAYGDPSGRPSVTIRRVVAQLEPLDNPNSTMLIFEDPDLRSEIIEAVIGGSASTTDTRAGRSASERQTEGDER